MKYINRYIDILLSERLRLSKAVILEGVKGSGKSRSASERVKTIINFRDPRKRDIYLRLDDVSVEMLLNYETPILFDECQETKNLLEMISLDQKDEKGLYLCVTSCRRKKPSSHPDNGIPTLELLPMSLYESGDSNGKISLSELFFHPESFVVCESSLTLDDIKFLLCRGGWPRVLEFEKREDQLEVARENYRLLIKNEVNQYDEKRRDSHVVEKIIRSYAISLMSWAAVKSLAHHAGISEPTFYRYKHMLEDLYIIDDLDSWYPLIRARSSTNMKPKRVIIDPSLCACALKLIPSSFDHNMDLLLSFFQTLVVRDLKVYSSLFDGHLSSYRDKYGVEVDVVLHIRGGQYALFDIRLGTNEEIEDAAKGLNKIEKMMVEKNEKEEKKNWIATPAFKAIIVAYGVSYQRTDGIYVIPIGCLRA